MCSVVPSSAATGDGVHSKPPGHDISHMTCIRSMLSFCTWLWIGIHGLSWSLGLCQIRLLSNRCQNRHSDAALTNLFWRTWRSSRRLQDSTNVSAWFSDNTALIRLKSCRHCLDRVRAGWSCWCEFVRATLSRFYGPTRRRSRSLYKHMTDMSCVSSIRSSSLASCTCTFVTQTRTRHAVLKRLFEYSNKVSKTNIRIYNTKIENRIFEKVMNRAPSTMCKPSAAPLGAAAKAASR